MLRPFKRIIFTIPTLTSLASKTTYPLTSLLFCSHHGSVENGWTQLKFGDTPIFHWRLWGGRITSRPTNTSPNNKTNNRVHFIHQRLRFFPPLSPFGIPRQRQAQVGDGRQTRAFHLLVSDLQTGIHASTKESRKNTSWNPSLFPGCPFGKLSKKTHVFLGVFWFKPLC